MRNTKYFHGICFRDYQNLIQNRRGQRALRGLVFVSVAQLQWDQYEMAIIARMQHGGEFLFGEFENDCRQNRWAIKKLKSFVFFYSWQFFWIYSVKYKTIILKVVEPRFYENIQLY